MTIQEMISHLESIPNSNLVYTEQQTNIINHRTGPGWVLAGPGSGKTEVLTVLLLRLLYVENDPIQENRIPPESIFITTFTRKAARNLEDRLSYYRNFLIEIEPQLRNIDVSKLRIGTLQSLCNDILQEFRSPSYQNVRLMNEFEQAMFVYQNSTLVNNQNLSFWNSLDFMFNRMDWRNHRFSPNKWAKTKALVKIFNRICEDRISVADVRNAGGYLEMVADAYEEYVNQLSINYRSDFSHLQKTFLDFLNHPVGSHFVEGGETDYQGIKWVLVDEYQDTNLIQEAIYLDLARQFPHNIIVVGDDDQALYRFRGGSVECMISFDEACNSYLNIPPQSIQSYPLIDNFRSHPSIVNFCNEFITSFPVMSQPGARVPGKQDLVPNRVISSDYPCLATLSGRTIEQTANLFAETVIGLIDNRIVQTPNQICLLLRSTRETPQNAGPYVNALRNHGIEVYNPRNKAFIEQEEIQLLLSSIISILDPNLLYLPQRPAEIADVIAQWLSTYNNLIEVDSALARYIAESRRRINNSDYNVYLDSSLSEIVYYLLGLEPFTTWLNNPSRRYRLGKLTELFENYSSMPVPNYPNVSRGSIRLSGSSLGEISRSFMSNFYFLFVGYIAQNGLDDVEDEEIISPVNMVPIMTIHQAKGLEFPFVFVGHVNTSPRISDSHFLEDILGQYPLNAARRFIRPPQQQRSELDLIRQFYVAYSRPEFALILLGTDSQLSQGRIPCGPKTNWLRQRTINI